MFLSLLIAAIFNEIITRVEPAVLPGGGGGVNGTTLTLGFLVPWSQEWEAGGNLASGIILGKLKMNNHKKI